MSVSWAMADDARFTVDSMLGSFARKLRIYGFDVIYDSKADDHDLIDICLREDRVLVTCDKALYSAASRRGVKSIFLVEDSDEERAATLFRSLGMKVRDIDASESRCPRCNSQLIAVSRDRVNGVVPESVLKRNNEFYMCVGCGKVYWQGGHWRRISAFGDNVKRLMRQA